MLSRSATTSSVMTPRSSATMGAPPTAFAIPLKKLSPGPTIHSPVFAVAASAGTE